MALKKTNKNRTKEDEQLPSPPAEVVVEISKEETILSAIEQKHGCILFLGAFGVVLGIICLVYLI